MFKRLISNTAARTMVNKYKVKGYEEFTKLVESLESTGENIHVFYSGGKDELGKSWCPYCVKGRFHNTPLP